MKKLFILVFAMLPLLMAAQFQVGKRSITYQDPDRSNRSVPADYFYPATTSGSNVPMAAGQFPLIVFGHGFIMNNSSLYQYIWDHLVPQGYICVFPTTEGSMIPAPNHLAFGLDLAFLNKKIKMENTVSASFFFNKVGATSAILGHSMGGKASVIACANNPDVNIMINFAASFSDPPTGATVDALGEYAIHVSVPSLIVSGGNDEIATVDGDQKPLYDTIPSTCKNHVIITGGGHCYFASQAGGLFGCEAGENLNNITITRAEQNETVLELITPYINYYLKGDAAAGVQFLAYLATSNKITHQRFCPTTGICNDNKYALNGYVYANNTDNLLHIGVYDAEISPVKVEILNISGQSVMNRTEMPNSGVMQAEINIGSLSPGIYVARIQQNNRVLTQRFIR